jgi:hypothetical protein
MWGYFQLNSVLTLRRSPAPHFERRPTQGVGIAPTPKFFACVSFAITKTLTEEITESSCGVGGEFTLEVRLLSSITRRIQLTGYFCPLGYDRV